MYKCKKCEIEFNSKEYYLTEDKQKCIFHCDKNNWDRIEYKEHNTFFREKIKKFFLKNKKINLKKESITFHNVIFPKFEENFFYQIEIDISENIDINFKECIFPFIIDFIPTNFKSNISFYECSINDISFPYKSDGGFIFRNCNFNNSKVHLSHCEFKKGLALISCNNIESIYMHRAIFHSTVSFFRSSIKWLNLSYTTFNAELILDNVDFLEELKFQYVEVYGSSYFKDVIAKKGLGLRDCTFHNKINFLDMECEVLDRETARIIKDSFEQQNNIIEANKFYAVEMKEREKELDLLKEPFEWIVFKTHALSSNHSQNWLLALFWIINITFLVNYFTYELSCDVDTIKTIDRTVFFGGGLILITYGITKLKEKFINLSLILFTFFSYLVYSNSYIDDSDLKEFSNMINPFSIMTEPFELSLSILIYKIIIGYLIYQFIISVRQNTRRK